VVALPTSTVTLRRNLVPRQPRIRHVPAWATSPDRT